MNYSVISDDIKISKLCFGCEPLGGFDWGEVDIPAIESAIEFAVDSGVNFFDTADIYGLGLSETRLSNILGSKRHDMQIATKGGVSWSKKESDDRATIKMDSSPKYLEKAIEDSLKRLRLDHIPIYYVHWPDLETDVRETFEFLQKEKEKGKIGLIGCSNYSALQIQQASEVSEVSLVQLPFNILDKELEDDILDVCERFDIGVVAYNVLANGLLTGKYNINSKFDESDRRSKLDIFQGEALKKALMDVDLVLEESKKVGLTPSQYAINWVNKNKKIYSVIAGIKSYEQIKENIKGIV